MQMAIHEEKERINERKVLDKEAEFKITREELSSEKQKFTSAAVELTKEKKDVAEQKKKNDYMLSLLKTKKVNKHWSAILIENVLEVYEIQKYKS